MSEKRGCLGALFGIGGTRALPGRSLPVLPRTRVDKNDLPVLIEVQRLGRAALQRLASGGEAGEGVAGEVVALVERIYELALRLADARRFLKQTDTARVNRRLTEIEVERIGADAAQLLALKASEDSLRRQLGLVARVENDVRALHSQLAASLEDLRELNAKLVAHLGNDLLLTEFQAAQARTAAATQAYVDTQEELADL